MKCKKMTEDSAEREAFDSEFELNWPSKGNKLLTATANRITGFGFDELVRQELLPEAFYEAGHRLISSARNTEGYDQNIIIYPVLYCYRHALELSMKEIINEFGTLAKCSATRAPNSHDLFSLWSLCRRIICDLLGPQGDKKAESRAEEFIRSLHNLDRNSDAFRYSMRKDGTYQDLPKGLYDPESLKSSVNGIQNFLSTVYNMLYEHRQNLMHSM